MGVWRPGKVQRILDEDGPMAKKWMKELDTKLKFAKQFGAYSRRVVDVPHDMQNNQQERLDAVEKATEAMDRAKTALADVRVAKGHWKKYKKHRQLVQELLECQLVLREDPMQLLFAQETWVSTCQTFAKEVDEAKKQLKKARENHKTRRYATNGNRETVKGLLDACGQYISGINHQVFRRIYAQGQGGVVSLRTVKDADDLIRNLRDFLEKKMVVGGTGGDWIDRAKRALEGVFGTMRDRGFVNDNAFVTIDPANIAHAIGAGEPGVAIDGVPSLACLRM